jgi:hypothetical protein
MPEYGLEAFASALRESLWTHGFLCTDCAS